MRITVKNLLDLNKLELDAFFKELTIERIEEIFDMVYDISKLKGKDLRAFKPSLLTARSKEILIRQINSLLALQNKDILPNKIPEPDKTFLEDAFFNKKTLVHNVDLHFSAEKIVGLSDGSIYKDNQNIQYVGKTTTKPFPSTESTQKQLNHGDIERESLLAGIFKRFLYKQAPHIQLMVGQNEIKDSLLINNNPNAPIALTSKFFDNFLTLKNFSGNYNPQSFDIVANAPQLKTITGFEKVIAACIILGDADFNTENIGIIPADGKQLAVKVDHGKASLITFKSELSIRSSLVAIFDSYKYANIPFNAQLLKQSIDEMTNISEEELTTLITSREHILKKTGFTPTHTSQHYIEIIKQNIKAAAEFSKTLDIISRTNAPDNIKNGDWLTSLGTLHPIAWAIKIGCRIDNQSPIDWAIRNEDLVPSGYYMPIATTDLHVAAQNGNIPAVNELLRSVNREEKEDYIGIVDNNGRTALHLAVAGNHTIVVQTILNNTTNKQKLLAQQDTYLLTSLHYAVIHGQQDTVRIILSTRHIDKYALLAIEDEYKKSSIYYALENRYLPIINIFIQHKALPPLCNITNNFLLCGEYQKPVGFQNIHFTASHVDRVNGNNIRHDNENYFRNNYENNNNAYNRNNNNPQQNRTRDRDNNTQQNNSLNRN